MAVMGMPPEDVDCVFELVAGILHLGNITFAEKGNYASVGNEECKYRCISAFVMMRACART